MTDTGATGGHQVNPLAFTPKHAGIFDRVALALRMNAKRIRGVMPEPDQDGRVDMKRDPL